MKRNPDANGFNYTCMFFSFLFLVIFLIISSKSLKKLSSTRTRLMNLFSIPQTLNRNYSVLMMEKNKRIENHLQQRTLKKSYSLILFSLFHKYSTIGNLIIRNSSYCKLLIFGTELLFNILLLCIEIIILWFSSIILVYVAQREKNDFEFHQFNGAYSILYGFIVSILAFPVIFMITQSTKALYFSIMKTSINKKLLKCEDKRINSSEKHVNLEVDSQIEVGNPYTTNRSLKDFDSSRVLDGNNDVNLKTEDFKNGKSSIISLLQTPPLPNIKEQKKDMNLLTSLNQMTQFQKIILLILFILFIILVFVLIFVIFSIYFFPSRVAQISLCTIFSSFMFHLVSSLFPYFCIASYLFCSQNKPLQIPQIKQTQNKNKIEIGEIKSDNEQNDRSEISEITIQNEITQNLTTGRELIFGQNGKENVIYERGFSQHPIFEEKQFENLCENIQNLDELNNVFLQVVGNLYEDEDAAVLLDHWNDNQLETGEVSEQLLNNTFFNKIEREKDLFKTFTNEPLLLRNQISINSQNIEPNHQNLNNFSFVEENPRFLKTKISHRKLPSCDIF